MENKWNKKEKWNFWLISTLSLSVFQWAAGSTYLPYDSSKLASAIGFVTLNGNLAINLRPTHSPLLNGKGQFTFLKLKSSHPSGIVVYPPKFEFFRN